jgi:uncharacterized protein DUF6802
VYVDEHGDDTSTTDTHGGNDELTVEVDGETYQVEENYDFDGDQHNDTAVVETNDGYIAFADTDHDGTADVAVEFDHDGNVVAGAGYNESTHEWTEEDVSKLPTPTGDGADSSGGGHGGSHTTTGHDSGHQTDTSSQGSDHKASDTHDQHSGGGHGSGGEDITVDTPKGQFDAGQANYDSNNDGVNDTAIVTDQDGTTYAFTDADGDGDADEAVVIKSDGDVTVAENKGGNEWEVTETGHLNSDGTYQTDKSGSDSVWAESR